MDRRTTLAAILGKSQKSRRVAKTAAVISGLDPYSGPWDYQTSAHLLRRTMYGPTNSQIKNAVQNGRINTLQQLLAPLPLPSPPVYHEYENDPLVPLGESWVDAAYSADNFNQIRNKRNASLYAWTAVQLYEENISIREKMTMFWHNHFATADVQDARFKYDYIIRLRSNALGNFKSFVKEMTVDPSMLRYLNGNQNTKNAPNENYARELLELFTIGKGPQVAPGDYTTYTEDDVVAMAKVLTGWVDRGYNDLIGIEITSQYVNNRHDLTDKQLSPRFDNVIISNAGDIEYSNLIDIIFQKEEVAFFICRKLYRWFVFYEINGDVETNVIAPMAQILLDNDYEIAPVIETLLSSEHFYDEANRGCMIKNPLDFTVGTLKQIQFNLPSDNTALYYNTLQPLLSKAAELQMEYFSPPSVAGWTAYYQEPSFYQIWINSVTLPGRKDVTTLFLFATVELDNGDIVKPDFLGMLNAFEDPFEVNAVIDEIVSIFFPKDIDQNQKDALKEMLIPGLPDFEWAVEYSEYISNPTDETLANQMSNKIRDLLNTMMRMPEYHLS